jgi:hypothetical protein
MKTSQMSRKIEAQNGVGAKSFNNFVAQWHCEEGIITIALSEKDRNIFKQFQQATIECHSFRPKCKVQTWALKLSKLGPL